MSGEMEVLLSWTLIDIYALVSNKRTHSFYYTLVELPGVAQEKRQPLQELVTPCKTQSRVVGHCHDNDDFKPN